METLDSYREFDKNAFTQQSDEMYTHERKRERNNPLTCFT